MTVNLNKNDDLSGNEDGKDKTLPFTRAAIALRRYLTGTGINSVLLGLSGGPDSVLTLHLLMEATKSVAGFRIGIAHANFHLRDEESMRDESFVRKLIQTYPQIEAHFASFDTMTYCREHGCSVETGARNLRHEWFDNLCATYRYDRIATGHNSGDNEETLMLNMLRGSGTRGLSGMAFDNGRVIRPLLQIPRREVIRMLDSLPQAMRTDPPFVIDSTNETDEYRRNFLRHRVLPLLDSRWEGARSGLQTTLRLMAEENRIVEHAVNSILQGISTNILPWEVIAAFPSPLTLIHRWIAPHGGTPERAAEMASAISEPGRPRTGGRWLLEDAEITATSEGLRLSPLSGTEIPLMTSSTPSCEVTAFNITPENLDDILTQVRKPSLTTAWLPGIPEDYGWRHPLKGERMRIGPKASKLISDILRESGITAALRPRISVLECRRTGRAVWIPGIRRSYDSRISGRENVITLYKIPDPESNQEKENK